jgi:serralysin
MSGIGNTRGTVNDTGDPAIDGILTGRYWTDSTVTYSFPQTNSEYSASYQNSTPTNNFQVATYNQIQAVSFALDIDLGPAAASGFSVEGFTNLNIAYTTATKANIRVANSDTPNTAFAYYPGTGYDEAGDVWLGSAYDSDPAYSLKTPVAGNYAWLTMIHELGHALGLEHSHENPSTPSAYDHMQYTVMSYRAYENAPLTGYGNEQWGFAQSFMMYDIAALQHMYGADYTTNSGNTVYKWDPNSGDTLVNGQVAIDAGGNRIFATIWDGGGIDTYDLSAYTTNLNIDLRPGQYSKFSDVQLSNLGSGNYADGNIYNALLYNGDVRSLIENIIAGSGNDNIIGNAADNTITTGGGNDFIDGKEGNDTVVFAGNYNQYNVTVGEVGYTVSGFGFNVYLENIEFLTFADRTVVLDNSAPVTTVNDLTVEQLAWTRLQDVLTVTDADADTITSYQIWDNEGGNNWWISGGVGFVDASRGYTVSDLSNIWFRGDATNSTQTLWLRAFDGKEWSEWENFTFTTFSATNTKPVASLDNQSLEPLEWQQLKNVLTVNDADSDAITSYEIWDDEGGNNWWISGGVGFVDASTGYEVSTLNSIWFRGDSTASTQTLWVRAFDGTDWSDWTQFDLTTTANANNEPVANVDDLTVQQAEWTRLQDVLTVTDADADTITSYQIWDDQGGNNWWIGGGVGFVDASRGYTVSDLSKIWFRGDNSNSSQTLWVRAFDGTDWSDWERFTLTTTDAAPANSPQSGAIALYSQSILPTDGMADESIDYQDTSDENTDVLFASDMSENLYSLPIESDHLTSDFEIF